MPDAEVYPVYFYLIGNSYQIKKHFVQNRTAAVWNFVANATRRRRRILQEQDSFLTLETDFSGSIRYPSW